MYNYTKIYKNGELKTARKALKIQSKNYNECFIRSLSKIFNSSTFVKERKNEENNTYSASNKLFYGNWREYVKIKYFADDDEDTFIMVTGQDV